MKAVRIHKNGGVDVLRYEDVPTPTPQAGEILIQIYATSINPHDAKVRQGSHAITAPYILGWDVAGVVVETQSPRFKVGDAVYGMPPVDMEGQAYAEYRAAPAEWFALKPRTLTHTEAATVPLVALTALQALDHTRAQANQRILIHAAAGGVGHFAVQLAKMRGLYVIGTASAANLDYVYGLGADEVIDYHSQAFEDVVHDVDIVFQTIAGTHGQRSMQTLCDNGIMITFSSKTEVYAERGIELINMQRDCYVAPNAHQLAQLAAWIDDGLVRPTVQAVYPLTAIAEAHRVMDAGHVRGKLAIQVYPALTTV